MDMQEGRNNGESFCSMMMLEPDGGPMLLKKGTQTMQAIKDFDSAQTSQKEKVRASENRILHLPPIRTITGQTLLFM